MVVAGVLHLSCTMGTSPGYMLNTLSQRTCFGVSAGAIQTTWDRQTLGSAILCSKTGSGLRL